MATPASIAGHPIHPMLVAFPIGLWVFSFICDLIFVLGHAGPVWNTMAYYSMAGGILGALLAALPGLVDLLSLEDARAKKVGIIHMALNLTIVALFAVDLWLRRSSVPGARLPIALSAIAIVTLAVSGWLGGELVFRHGVGVESRSDVPPVKGDRVRAA